MPLCKINKRVTGVVVTLDEFEALRLADLNGMHQIDAAKRLRISRPTFSRIIESARKKVADGLVNIKMIKIEGGCCEIIPSKKSSKKVIVVKQK